MILSSQMKNMTIIGLFLVREDQCQDINCIHDCYLRQARWHITNLVEKMSYVGPFLVINWLVFNMHLRQKKKYVFPIDPKILPPTLTFFMPKKKNRLAKSGNSSPFPTSTIFFISLYIWSMFETKNIVLHAK